jgi:enoyl-CoA hydratase/carnithine racemase
MAMPVHYEIDDRIATITLDRPEAMNALDPPMLWELADAWDKAEADDDVWVVLVTGAGDRAFCVGADLKTTIRAKADGRAPLPDSSRSLLRDRVFPKPVVAAVNGYCIGGGLELLLGTDLRYASETATFALQEVRWGVFPAGGGSVGLPRQIPYCRAMELLLLGDRVDAATAMDMGLLNGVVPAGEVLGRARAAAERICRNGPLAVRRVKESVARGLGMLRSDAYREELRLSADVFTSDDAREGALAFAEKRPPRFTGR